MEQLVMNRRQAAAALAVTTLIPSLAFAAKNMGAAEKKHAERTLAAGAIALQTSKVAQQKAQNAWVKKFAGYEVAEQTTIAEVLKAAGASPSKPDESDTAAASKVEQASGAAFDIEYLTAQISGHEKLLQIQEEYIGSGKDAAHIAIAKLARGQIKEHIDLLQTIQKDLKV
jgi:predicted outer membrane protein